MTTVITDPADLLDRAAAEIERRGLIQHAYIEDTQNFDAARLCAIGALSVTLHGEGGFYDREMYVKALWHLAFHIGGDAEESDEAVVAHWNDAPGRTAEEVAAKMRAAARDARGGVS